MKSNLTLVTALFDLGRGEMGTSFSRSFEHYKECFSRLLKLDFNLVIFCEDDLEEFIWQYRKPENTKIIKRTKDDLRDFPFFKQIQSIRTNEDWLNQAGWLRESTQARLELYNPLVMSKQFLLNDATLYNFFNTENFLWVDAGISNTVSIENYFDSTFERRITKHLNKMLYICFPYDGTVEVHGFQKAKLNELADANTEFVARGGVFGGSKFAINQINDIYYSLLGQTLNAGFMGTEESIFTIIAHRHRSKCNIRMIDGNGLVVKFFEDLKKEAVKNTSSSLALYVLTFNFPKQLELWVKSFKKAYPKEFGNLKKYVINNSDDISVKEDYDIIFKENDLEVIHEGQNLGINDGRHLAAVHFENSDHDYMIFFEDDMLMHDGKIPVCKNGFATYADGLFRKSMTIVENHDLDYLKLSFSEFYGDNHDDWAWHNVPAVRHDLFWPKFDKSKERPSTDIAYTASYMGLSFAVGNFHFCNWPLLFSRRGNRRVFLDITYEHKFEQTIMSQTRQFMHEGNLKAGCLLLSPINHVRNCHYDRSNRKENKYG